MANQEIELNPVDFITIGTIGPKGQRVFHLQGGQGKHIVSLTIEKEQAWALSEAIREMLEDLDQRKPPPEGDPIEASLDDVDMDLREPIEPLFRVAQMGLGYDEDLDRIVLVAQELVPRDEEENEAPDPSVVRMWCDRQQMRNLSAHTMQVVQAGRADPRQNGRLVYYWT
ncbi:MAG: DUF3090 family protein [Anaerolineaceae bacterium]|nr:DUF3090 family protein [Anaerolineaceae bacterium]